MKKRKNFSLFVKFALVMVLSLNVVSCNKSDAYKNFDIKTDAFPIMYDDVATDRSYIKVSDIYGNNQKPVGRYANVTKDGKIRWDLASEDVDNGDMPIAEEIANKVTLDGRSVKLPMTFADLGEEYKEFDGIDYSKFSKKDDMIILTNKNKNIVLYIDYILLDGKPNEEAWAYLFKDNKFMIRVDIRNNKIYGLHNQYSGALSNMELKFDGIGAGNTFNEMYDKFGQISAFYIYDSSYHYVVTAAYNIKDKIYINFDSEDNKDTDKIGGKGVVYRSKPNVITNIDISIY